MNLLELREDLLSKLPADAVKLDLGCGEDPLDGFRGVDLLAPNAERVDLFTYPWPWADGSVDYFRASHFVEHVPDWDAHFTEAYRCLKPGGHYEILGPFYANARFFQDPDHKQPLLEERFWYLSREWRKRNKIAHYGAQVNFLMLEWFYSLNPDFVDSGYSDEAMHFHKRHSWNCIDDIATILQKQPLED
jgi:predicted SAM-dependent methyltransferase